MKTILFVVLQDYADWEAASLAAAVNRTDGCEVKTVSLTKDPVRSIGGFSVTPDVTIDEAIDMPYDGLVLVGGNSWRTPDAQQVMSLVSDARKRNIVIGAICDATVFLGVNGMLNECVHTSNWLDGLVQYAGNAYTGSALYKNEQSVRGTNLVTANGTAHLEFARDMLIELGIMTEENALLWYRFYKYGICELFKEPDAFQKLSEAGIL